MPEYQRPGWMRPGHLFDTDIFRIDLWRLLSMYLSSKPLAQLNMADKSELLELENEFLTDEITRILLTSAIIIRIADDREGKVIDRHSSPVGTLQKNINKKDIIDLSLREACNKIIHAESFNFDVSNEYDTALYRENNYLEPFIYYYGRSQNIRWRAVLSVIDFIQQANRFLKLA